MPVSLPGARDGAQRRPRFGEEKPKVTPNQRLDADRPPFSPRTRTPIPPRRHFSPTPLQCPFSPFAPSGIPQRIDPTEIPSQNPPPQRRIALIDPTPETPSENPLRIPSQKPPDEGTPPQTADPAVPPRSKMAPLPHSSQPVFPAKELSPVT